MTNIKSSMRQRYSCPAIVVSEVSPEKVYFRRRWDLFPAVKTVKSEKLKSPLAATSSTIANKPAPAKKEKEGEIWDRIHSTEPTPYATITSTSEVN